MSQATADSPGVVVIVGGTSLIGTGLAQYYAKKVLNEERETRTR